ncbi:MAG: sodium:solute symporter [Acidobacteriota bacterium]
MKVLHPLDWIAVIAYFAVIAGIVVWVTKRQKKTSDGYFLAGRELGWFVIGAAMAHYELHAWCLLVLAWVMVPFYMRSRVFTMPEFLEKRFSPTSRTVLSVISLVAYVLTKIAVGIFAGGIVFSVLLPELNLWGFDSFWIGSFVVIVVTGLYTIVGGMGAVAYTEALQTVVLIIGSALVTFFGLQALGGWAELRAIIPSDMFNLWKPLVPDGLQATWAPVRDSHQMAWYFNDNYPWLGMLICAPVIGLWYWCTDQYIVQRALAAPNETEARRGSIMAAFFKLLPVFIFIIPGIICYALAISGKMPDLGNLLIGPDGEIIRDNAQQAFPLMVAKVLPIGVRGIVVAGLLAALMSSLAGAFNASATLFTIDFYKRLHKGISQEKLVWVGRVATFVMVLIGICWIPVIKGGRGLYDYLQGVQSYLAPPIFVVFFLGVFYKRLNAKGCLWALITGFILGIFRLAVDTPVKMMEGFQYQQGSFLWIVNNIFFQYYSMIILFVSALVMIVVSHMTAAPSYEKISGLTYATRTDADKRATRESWKAMDVILSLVVIVLILAAYMYFVG